MLNINKKYIHNSTIRSIFNKVCKNYPDNIFLSSGSFEKNNSIRMYTFKEVKKHINKNISFLEKCNLVIGDRVSVMVGNNPEYFILKLSLNYFGLSCIPLNNELSSKEINFILKNSEPRYIIFSSSNENIIKKVLSFKKSYKTGLIKFDYNNLKLIVKSKKKSKEANKKLNAKLESSILYTSGTTASPKGCILTNEYELNAGYSYSKKKVLISFQI